MNQPADSKQPAPMRIDKWLWAARFYKTRALAAEEIQKGRVQINNKPCKPAREIVCGDTISLRQGLALRTIVVQALIKQRGSAPQAQQLYSETAESIATRTALAEQRRYAPEPAHSLQQGRPTKRDRRQMQQIQQMQQTHQPSPDNWNGRWSASID